MYGFNLDTAYYTNVGYTGDLINRVYNFNASSSSLAGTVYTKVIFSTQKKKVNGAFVNVAMIHSTVAPRMSDNLNLSVQLGASQKYLISQPNNIAGASQYTLGGSLNGVSASVSAGTTLTYSALTITNKSNINKKYFEVDYKYNPDWLNFFTGRDSYLKNQSTQKAILYYSNTASTYKFPLKIKTKFTAPGTSGQNPFWADNTRTFTIALGNK